MQPQDAPDLKSLSVEELDSLYLQAMAAYHRAQNEYQRRQG